MVMDFILGAGKFRTKGEKVGFLGFEMWNGESVRISAWSEFD